MQHNADLEWWTFSIDHALHTAVNDQQRTDETGDLYRVYAPHQTTDYATYLALDTLLAAQIPASPIPDERIFIITHQLTELVFKLMIFDLGVIACTFIALLEQENAQLFQSSLHNEPFWRPALTASARLVFSSTSILPLLVQYLRSGPDETFNREEFFAFREQLGSASGLQSAQFRLIQRALGKFAVLSIRLFPRDAAQPPVPEARDRLVALLDPSILREASAVATPAQDSALASVAQFDDLAHRVLAGCARFADDTEQRTLPLIEQADIDHAVSAMDKLAANKPAADDTAGSEHAVTALFRQDLERVAQDENARRSRLAEAQLGARYLRTHAPTSYLTQVLERLATTDTALFGEESDSFLSAHMSMARDMLRKPRADGGEAATVQGTGGGGVSYLGFVRKYLLPLFPALVAFRA